MSEPKNLRGQCLCGAVTVEAAITGEGYGVCHCSMCRRWSSGPFFNLRTDPETVKSSGPVKSIKTSKWAERAFCGECGSALWYKISAGGMTHVSAGLFEESKAMTMTHEVFIDNKPDGYAFEGERKRMTEADVFKQFG